MAAEGLVRGANDVAGSTVQGAMSFSGPMSRDARPVMEDDAYVPRPSTEMSTRARRADPPRRRATTDKTPQRMTSLRDIDGDARLPVVGWVAISAHVRMRMRVPKGARCGLPWLVVFGV